MHVVLWRYRVRPGCETRFERAYADDGDWSRLFRRSDAYLGSELMRGTDGTYLTIDRWVSEDAYRAFKDKEAAPYAELDARCATWMVEEAMVAAVDA